MKILLLGSNGMLARDLAPVLSKKHELILFPRERLDITKQADVRSILAWTRPNIVVNCAAFTKVDQCETLISTYDVNMIGPMNIAQTCKTFGVRFVHFSTDYVFDGSKNLPHENNPVNPLNHYGKSKLGGEIAIQASGCDFLIIRLQWLFGKHGDSFVKKMNLLANLQNKVTVVNDQIGRPTNTKVIANAITRLINDDVRGIWHLGSSDYCSWYDFAKAILKDRAEVIPCRTDDVAQKAKRPRENALSVSKYQNIYKDLMPWQEHLEQYMKDV